jgi:hypothetical protein
VSAPVLVLRAETDDVVPHSHTDLLVSKLATVVLDQIIPKSDHYNIPYLTETQGRIARFLHNRLFGAETEVRAAVPYFPDVAPRTQDIAQAGSVSG